VSDTITLTLTRTAAEKLLAAVGREHRGYGCNDLDIAEIGHRLAVALGYADPGPGLDGVNGTSNGASHGGPHA